MVEVWGKVEILFFDGILFSMVISNNGVWWSGDVRKERLGIRKLIEPVMVRTRPDVVDG